MTDDLSRDRYARSLIPGKDVVIYAGRKKVRAALEALSNMDLFSGVKIIDLIEIAYKQGKKDGAREMLETMTKAGEKIPHKNPGKPK